MSEIKLPEGWVWRTLQNLGQWSGGGTPSKANPEFWQGGNVAWVSPKDMKSMYIQDTEDKITSEAVINSSAKYIDPPALLFVVRSGILRRTLPVALTYNRLTVNQDIKTLSLSGQVHPEYVYYYLQCENRQILTNCSKAGTTVESIEIGLLKQVAIPLPSLPIQQAIVTKIEELFSELDAGVKELQTALARLKTYRQAVLHHYLNNPEWERVKLGEVCLNLDGKRVPLSKQVRSTRKGEYRYYGATEVVDYIDDYLFDGKYLLIGEDGANLLSRAKPLSFIVEGKFWVNNHAHILQTKDSLDINFINQYFNSIDLRDYVTGSAQPKLTQANLNKIVIPLPDLTTQEQIVSEIESRLSQADAMEATIRQELVRAESLRQSILKQAFEGKLVTNPVAKPELELAEASEPDQTIYRSQNAGPAGEQLSLF